MSVDKFGRQSSSQSSAMAPGASVRYVNNNFIRRDGSNDIEGELSMNNHKLVNLSEPTEVQDAATRGYVKNFTRNNFLKIDGTNNMEGDLNVNNHKIINLSDPVDDGDVITKSYLKSITNNFLRRPLITIWAQENGPLNSGEFEWSFGSGDIYTLAKCGYCMPARGRIIRGSLSSVNEENPSGKAVVHIVINGVVMMTNHITKPPGVFSYTETFRPPTTVDQNDRINFQTLFSTDATNSIVSLLIELNLGVNVP